MVELICHTVILSYGNRHFIQGTNPFQTPNEYHKQYIHIHTYIYIMSVVDAHLEIDPEQAIEFTLIDSTTTTTTTSTPQTVTLTLKHPDVDGLPIAFKVCVLSLS